MFSRHFRIRWSLLLKWGKNVMLSQLMCSFCQFFFSFFSYNISGYYKETLETAGLVRGKFEILIHCYSLVMLVWNFSRFSIKMCIWSELSNFFSLLSHYFVDIQKFCENFSQLSFRFLTLSLNYFLSLSLSLSLSPLSLYLPTLDGSFAWK